MKSRNKLLIDKLQLEAMPILSRKCKEGNPIEFTKWNGNLCSQAAFFTALFLQHEMGIFPEDIYVCESKYRGFNNSIRQSWQEWTHAWVYVVIDGQGYTFDQHGILGLQIQKASEHELSFANNPYLQKVRELDRDDFVNWELMIESTEFYTGKLMTDLYIEITEEMNNGRA